jgi:hypothetical protein
LPIDVDEDTAEQEGDLSTASVHSNLSPGSSQESLFSLADSIFSNDEDDDDCHGNVLTAGTPPLSHSPLLSSAPLPPYKPSTPTTAQAHHGLKATLHGVSSILSVSKHRNLQASRQSTPTLLPPCSDSDLEATPRANHSSLAHTPPMLLSEDEELFGTQKPGLLPVNPISTQAWKGINPAHAVQYLQAFMEAPPTAQSMVMDTSGLAGGIAAEQTVFARTPHTGIGRAAGDQVQSSKQDRITVASGCNARVMTIMPAAGTAAVAYMQKGEVLVHTVYGDNVDDVPSHSTAAVAPLRARQGKNRVATPPSPTPSSRATTPLSSPPASPLLPPPPIKKPATTKTLQHHPRHVPPSAMVIEDSPPSSLLPLIAVHPAGHCCRSNTLIAAVPATALATGSRRQPTVAPVEAVSATVLVARTHRGAAIAHVKNVPVTATGTQAFDLTDLLAAAPTTACPIACCPRKHTYVCITTGPKAFHWNVEAVLAHATKEDILGGGLAEDRLRSTPLKTITALIMPLLSTWGHSLASILQMTILAEISHFPHEKNMHLPGTISPRPNAVHWFIKCGRLLMPGVFTKYSAKYPKEYESYWHTMLLAGADPRRDLSHINNNLWTVCAWLVQTASQCSPPP